MCLNKKFLLLILAALAFNVECATLGAHTFGTEDLKEGSPLRVASTPSALEQLLSVDLNAILVDRIAAWNQHVHPVIAEVLGSENYSQDLRNIVSAASWKMEIIMRKPFDGDEEVNKGRVLELAASLLACKSLEEQAVVLMHMVEMHKIFAQQPAESVES